MQLPTDGQPSQFMGAAANRTAWQQRWLRQQPKPSQSDWRRGLHVEQNKHAASMVLQGLCHQEQCRKFVLQTCSTRIELAGAVSHPLPLEVIAWVVAEPHHVRMQPCLCEQVRRTHVWMFTVGPCPWPGPLASSCSTTTTTATTTTAAPAGGACNRGEGVSATPANAHAWEHCLLLRMPPHLVLDNAPALAVLSGTSSRPADGPAVPCSGVAAVSQSMLHPSESATQSLQKAASARTPFAASSHGCEQLLPFRPPCLVGMGFSW